MNSFFSLSPDAVLNAIEKNGYFTTGELYQLNSYENRVFNIRLEPNDLDPRPQLIAKFYRPGRWSLPALREEHQFLQDLLAESVPVVAPLKLKNNLSLDSIDGPIHYALFPKTPGRMPEEFFAEDWSRIGRLIARLHNCGAHSHFKHRPTMGEQNHIGWQSLDILENWVSPEVWPRYEQACLKILDFLDAHLPQTSFLRIHGDCHRGNILSNGESFFFVDFDDCLNGPAVQDLWMLLPGELKDVQTELDLFLTGYTEFRNFSMRELDLIPALRGLRIFSYAAWIANRWQDPSFPRLFPQFNTYLYWSEEVESLERMAWSL
jgi:Ser/Thr protein kinase RdoA (MazF antagonist)